MTGTAGGSVETARLEPLEPRLLLSSSTALCEPCAQALAGEASPLGEIGVGLSPGGAGTTEPLPGDANLDGRVDGLDYNIWSGNYLQTGVGWEGGDFTGDGIADGLDYGLWSQYYDGEPQAPPDDPVPGSEVSWYTEDLTQGQGLVVLGTDGADRITVSRSGPDALIITSAGTFTLGDSFISVRLYGFGGDDLLVTISGAAEAVWGGEGLDSFWADSLDTIGDADSTETAAGSVHQVSEFYQPSDDPAEYVSLELAGQDIIDPQTSAAYADFSDSPLFVDGPDFDDIHQGGVADCYFLAALSSLAQTDPNSIKQMIAPLGDGTYAVRFYRSGAAEYLRIDAELPVLYPSLPYTKYARPSPDGELWVALAEKAYAQFRTGQNSYDSLAYGWMDAAYGHITGGSASRTYTAGMSESEMAGFIADSLEAGYALSAASCSSATEPIVHDHAYVVTSVQNVGGEWSVTLYNVHGQDGFDWDGNRSDGLLTISLAIFLDSFSAVCTSLT